MIISYITLGVLLLTAVLLIIIQFLLKAVAMNDEKKILVHSLYNGSLVVIIAAYITLISLFNNQLWYSFASAIIGLTGVAIYFKRLRSLITNEDISHQNSDLMSLLIWLSWLFLFILIITHLIIIWIY